MEQVERGTARAYCPLWKLNEHPPELNAWVEGMQQDALPEGEEQYDITIRVYATKIASLQTILRYTRGAPLSFSHTFATAMARKEQGRTKRRFGPRHRRGGNATGRPRYRKSPRRLAD